MLHSEQKRDAAIKKGAPVFYFYSTDAFLARSAAEKTCSILTAGEDTEITQLDGPAPSVEEIIMAAGTISFFGTRRLVELPALQPTAYSEKDMADVIDAIESAENAVFVIYSVFAEERGKIKLPKNGKKLADVCEKVGYAAQIEKPGPQQLRQMLRQRAESLNTTLSENAAATLLERCGEDLFQLENEVDKLAAASNYTEITPALVAQFATQNLEADVFDMVRAVTARNAARACEKLDTLLRLQNEPIAIAAALLGSYVDMARVKAGQTANKNYSQVHKDFGYRGSDYRLKKSMETAARYSMGQLNRCLDILLELDSDLKGSPVDRAVLLQTALCRLSVGVKP